MARTNLRPGRLRIIGGRWRGQPIDFPADAGIRPTGDRVRETLFNWLQFELPGRSCLDLYAGSGALGFEALSRGAESATLVERLAPVADQLERTRRALGADGALIRRTDAERFIDEHDAPPFGLVFLDPPFGATPIDGLCERLAEHGLVAPGTLVYIETSSTTPRPRLPAGWRWRREKKTGQVCYYLAEISGPDHP